MKELFTTACSVEDVNKNNKAKTATLEEFCDWMMFTAVAGEPGTVEALPSGTGGITDFVLVGHSMWIREFFQHFVDRSKWGMFSGFAASLNSRLVKKEDIERAIASEGQKMSNEGILKFKVNFIDNPKKPGYKTCRIVPKTTKFVKGNAQNRFGLGR
jgi:hypothetical protein